MDEIVVFFDGSIEPNPNGTMGLGVVVFQTEGFIIEQTGKVPKTSYKSCKRIYSFYDKINPGERGFKTTTNNIAEYLAFQHALEFIRDNEVKKAFIFGDSNMVIQQMKGAWKIGRGAYVNTAIHCDEMLNYLIVHKKVEVIINWIPREFNSVADNLSRT